MRRRRLVLPQTLLCHRPRPMRSNHGEYQISNDEGRRQSMIEIIMKLPRDDSSHIVPAAARSVDRSP